MGAEVWLPGTTSRSLLLGQGGESVRWATLTLSSRGGATCASAGVHALIHAGSQVVNLHQYPTTICRWLSAKTPRKEGRSELYIFRVDH